MQAFVRTSLLIFSIVALWVIASGCSQEAESLNQRSSGQLAGIEGDKQLSANATTTEKGGKSSGDLPSEDTDSGKGNPNQSTAQQPTKDPGTLPPVVVAKACQFVDPANPTFTIAKDQFGTNLPPRNVPSSQIVGELQPDQKTYVGKFNLFAKKNWANNTLYDWVLADGANLIKSSYSIVITGADTEACQTTIRLVSRENRSNNGCFAATTQIRMANGSDMMIALITAGDLVYNPVTRTNVRVAEVVEGPEASKSMYEIRVGQRKVTVTSAHPFATTGGLKQAQHLVAGDRILGVNGIYEAITEAKKLPVNQAQIVVNIRLESGTDEDAHMVLADGIVTGDLYLQRQLQQ